MSITQEDFKNKLAEIEEKIKEYTEGYITYTVKGNDVKESNIDVVKGIDMVIDKFSQLDYKYLRLSDK